MGVAAKIRGLPRAAFEIHQIAAALGHVAVAKETAGVVSSLSGVAVGRGAAGRLLAPRKVGANHSLLSPGLPVRY